jgi:beta-lactamase class A
MCSTFKLLLVGAILNKIANGLEQYQTIIPYGPADLLEYAPITRAHVAQGHMTIEELCAAAIEYSDNTAANLLLASFGGPKAVTGYARWLGDNVTRLDRNEPSLNTAIPGDPRDTTSPDAMLDDLKRLTTGHGPGLQSAALNPMLLACKTADHRIRAGLPKGWKSGNKTGTGSNGSTNDVAILWPPHDRKPMLLSVYFTGSKLDLAAREAVIADVARVVVGLLG